MHKRANPYSLLLLILLTTMSLRDDLPYLLSIPQYSSVAQTVATIGQQSDNHQIMESSVATMYIHPVGLSKSTVVDTRRNGQPPIG